MSQTNGHASSADIDALMASMDTEVLGRTAQEAEDWKPATGQGSGLFVSAKPRVYTPKKGDNAGKTIFALDLGVQVRTSPGPTDNGREFKLSFASNRAMDLRQLKKLAAFLNGRDAAGQPIPVVEPTDGSEDAFAQAAKTWFKIVAQKSEGASCDYEVIRPTGTQYVNFDVTGAYPRA